MVAAILALASSLSWGLSDFLAGIKTRELAVIWVLLVSQATGLALVTFAAVAWGEPLPGLHAIGWAAVLGGTAGLGAGAVAPPFGTRRTPVSGVPLAGPDDDGSLLWPRRMVTPPCWAWADCAAVNAASTRRG